MISCSFRVFGFATAISATLGGGLGVCVARADSQPVIAIPGHLGVPVIINGIDATGAAVYGDWGLSRPGQGRLIIEGGTPTPLGRPPVRYFPTSSTVQDPRGSETKAAPSPPRGAPPARPAASTDFHQSWSAGANPGPMPEGAPSVIVAPPHPSHLDKVPGGTTRP
ncbi:MAG TPA: hypothetical protein VEK55_09890 [Xanthobacteraceae bacterium]|nr:hypothetical protein [Xanthobacteraceae bacterium]